MSDPIFNTLMEWDPEWTEKYLRMSTNPVTGGILPRKMIALIGIALQATSAQPHVERIRRQVCTALEMGCTREEILEVFKVAAVLSVHAGSLGAPLLLEEAAVAGIRSAPRRGPKPSTPACDQMRALGHWDPAWDPFFELDPAWTEEFLETGLALYQSGILSPKTLELIGIAFDASSRYSPGARRHIKAALKLGATMEEITEVLKICVAEGTETLRFGVPILEQEWEAFESRNPRTDRREDRGTLLGADQ